jgi:hypothetical protein
VAKGAEGEREPVAAHWCGTVVPVLVDAPPKRGQIKSACSAPDDGHLECNFGPLEKHAC